MRALRPLTAAVMAVFLAGCLQRALLYYPSDRLPTPAEIGATDYDVVQLTTADGLVLTAWHAAAMEDRPTIVYLQGNAGNIAGRVPKLRPFRAAGYGVLLVGYRGYGGNPGTPSEAGLLADGEAGLAYLADAGVPPDRVVLFGESLGTAIAVRLAADRQVAALVLEAPFTSIIDAGRYHYPFLPVETLAEDRFDTIRHITGVSAPVLIVHGERDRIVPVTQGRRLLAAAPGPKRGVFLRGAGHNNLAAFGAADVQLAFLAEFVGP